MSDVDGLEEFGDLACWRDVLLRYPEGLTKPYRVVQFAGHLPINFERPLNDARTAYERFVRANSDGDVPTYDLTHILER